MRTSKLGASQIHWLSDLTLFNFNIKYRAGKSNQAADALSWWPVNPDSSSESLDEKEEKKTISYEVVCQILDFHLDSSKSPYTIKQEVQTNIMDIEEAYSSEGFCPANIVDVQLNEVKTFDTISLHHRWWNFKRKILELSLIYECVHNNSKPKLSEIHHIQLKPIQCNYYFSLTSYL